MTANRMRDLLGVGQSVWLDEITRDWLHGGQLADWIARLGLRGVTSNPTIFQNAIERSTQYDPQIAELAALGKSAAEIYDAVTLDDIRAACDSFRSLYEASGGLDGFVSHEVSPDLAYDTWGTVHEARRLWAAVDRPNVMIKIPATEQGIPAVVQCLAEGINVNITLMFSTAHYDAVSDAYLTALERRAAEGGRLERIASVASFFVSRVDTLVDGMLDARLGNVGDPREAEQLRGLKGQAAVANAKSAYRRYQRVFTSARFARLEARGARTQRVLWASTSTKDPSYSDIKYVDELIGPHTVNTLPRDTVEAFLDHGTVAQSLTSGLEHADKVVRDLELIGIDLVKVGETLSSQGVEKFRSALQGVLATVEARRRELARDAG